ncbi:hypothetical protein LCGC14_2878580, partial [marine sediment metagenome]
MKRIKYLFSALFVVALMVSSAHAGSTIERRGTSSSVDENIDADWTFLDDKKLYFGTDQDFSIFFKSADSSVYMEENGLVFNSGGTAVRFGGELRADSNIKYLQTGSDPFLYSDTEGIKIRVGTDDNIRFLGSGTSNTEVSYIDGDDGNYIGISSVSIIGATEPGGTLTLSSTTHATKGHVAVADPMALLNGTAPTNSPANLIQIYAEDVGGSSELKVRDEAGDVTVLSEPASTVQFVIDGGGGTITTGDKGHLEAPFNCTLTGGHGMADQSGSIVVDIWKDTYANFPPLDADSITASAPVTITSA